MHDPHSHPEVALPTARARRALAVLAGAQFMVVLDVTVANVALPSVGADLRLSASGLQWVITAYTLTFGGLLLVGGRAADLLGRRRMFLAGLLVFTGASLAAGLARSEPALLAARVAQGAGAAALSPAALSLIAVIVPPGPERHRAFALWGAIGAGGAAAGVLVGGILTEAFGWQAAFLVNVPVGLVAAALALRVLPSTPPARGPRGVDVAGAALATGGLLATLLALADADEAGWGSTRTLGLAGVAVLALAGFVAWERRAAAPLVDLAVLRRRAAATALGLMLVAAGTLVAAFFLLSLHLQQTLGHSALRTGLEFLPAALAIVVAARAGAHALSTAGAGPVIAGGMAMAAVGAGLLAGVDAGDRYVSDVLPGFVALAAGLGFAFVAITTAAMAGAGHHDAGLLSALTSTAHELGAAVLLAVLATVAAQGAAGGPIALGAGSAFAVAAAVLAAAALAALVLLRGADAAPGHAPAFVH